MQPPVGFIVWLNLVGPYLLEAEYILIMEENDEVLFWICLYIYIFSMASTRNPEKTTFALVSFRSSIMPTVSAIKNLQ